MPTGKRKIAHDDNPEWTKERMARAVPLSALPKSVQVALSTRKRGPQKLPTKVAISIRLSQDVLDSLKATGDGWQTRVDEILRTSMNRRARLAKQRAA